MVQLVNQLERASIWLEAEQKRFEGTIAYWDQTGVVVHLPPTAEVFDLLQPSKEVVLTLYARDGTQQVKAFVQTCQGGACSLRFEEGAMLKLGRRRHARYPCHLPVQYRPSESGTQDLPWQQATAVEIGIGGMRLVIEEPAVSIPGRLAVRFSPVGYEGQIQAFGRLAYCRTQQDGTTIVGVAFEELSPLDRIWLERLFR
ncbi:MAG: PilZ domain-containing protein [candidate division WOR-3 bacterium]